MANRFYSPNQQFCDGTGAPYAGGSLAFYASGTSTPLATYSNQALTIANSNPIALDSAGRGGAIFLQNLAYKVVLSDVNSNVIWTADPVYSSDFSTVAQFPSGNGSPNGFVAGSAGSTTIPASTYWDTTNNILYVCTQTGTVSTAVWTAVNAASAAAVVVPPQGYLTPTSATPLIASDAISATTIYYTSFVGNLVPIYTGSAFTPTVFSELTMTLTSSQAANGIYDLFVFNNSGVLTLVTGPAWSSATAGSCSRGTGAGTSQLSRISGLWVNTVQITGRNGSSTYSIPANQATYLGSLFIDSVAGQVTLNRSYGQARKWGIWNAYNRSPILLQCGDGTGTWPGTTAGVIRAANGNTANKVTSFCGLPEEEVTFGLIQTLSNTVSLGTGGSAAQNIGLGLNVTNGFFGKVGYLFQTAGNLGSVTEQITSDASSIYVLTPTLGINNVTALEEVITAGFANTFFGTINGMALTASWRG